jgi:hypothetical protein
MKNAVATSAPLWLHSDPNRHVWYSSGNELPQDSGLTADKFIHHPILEGSADIRILGIGGNASLVKKLHQLLREKDGVGPRVSLGTPSVCANIREQQDPEIAILRMRSLNRPLSVGGWHEITDKDLATYRLVEWFDHENDLDDLRCRLKQHPAYLAVRFMGMTDLKAAAFLLSTINDPRWHTDCHNPDRVHRLFNYLGLWPRNFADIVIGDFKEHRYSVRASAALLTWAHTAPKPNTEPLNHNFLWRMYRDKLQHGYDVAIAALRTTQHFIVFLRQVWLDQLSQQELFVPELFFRDEKDSACFIALQDQFSLYGPDGFDIEGQEK